MIHRSFLTLSFVCALPLAIACSGSPSPGLAPPLGSTGGAGGSGTGTGASGGHACPAPPAIGACALTMGLTGWWRAQGNPDASVSGANGVWLGTAHYEDGKICEGFELDGASYLRAPFTQTGPLTIDFWAASSAVAEQTFDAAFASGDVAAPPYFQVDSDGTGNYRLYAETEIGIGPILDATYQHVAITYDGSTVVAYLDGKAVGNADWSHNQPLQFVTLKIGSNRITSRFFKGVIDEVHIWNRALSAAEITSLYQIDGQTLCP